MVKKLFQAYMQADDSISRRFGGTGLGLTICKKMIEQMLGNIVVSSVPGQGSTFRFDLYLHFKYEHKKALNARHKPVVYILEDKQGYSKHAEYFFRHREYKINLISNLSQLKQIKTIDLLVCGQNTPLESLQNESYKTLIYCQTKQQYRSQADNLIPFYSPYTQKRLAGLTSKISGENEGKSISKFQFDDYSQMSVLVVDDNVINRKVLGAILRKFKISIEYSESGEAAIENIKKAMNFDLIFMDIEMPGFDGYQTTEKIREQLVGKASPYMVGLSAHTLAESREKAMRSGMDDFQQKPLRVPQLIGILKKVNDLLKN